MPQPEEVLGSTSDESRERQLLLAAACADEVGMEDLLANGRRINPNCLDNGHRTPLSWAAENGCKTVVKLLLGARAEPDFPDKSGRTPLSWAAEHGCEIVVDLLKAGANPNSPDEHGKTPLAWASRRGQESVAARLLATAGVDPNYQDKYGRTPLWWAAWCGHDGVVKQLLAARGIEPDRTDCYGRTPLSLAAGLRGSQAMVELLLDHRRGVNPDYPDKDGHTPLSWAARSGHEENVKLLLMKGHASPTRQDRDGRTPLWWAKAKGHGAVMRLLLVEGHTRRQLETCNLCRGLTFKSDERHRYGTFGELEIAAQSCSTCSAILSIIAPDPGFGEVVGNPNDVRSMIVTKRDDGPEDWSGDVLGRYTSGIVEINTAARWLGVRFMLNWSGGKVADRAIWHDTHPVTFEKSFPILQAWVKQCANGHPCLSAPQPLPKRLICMESMKLVKTRQGQTGRYAALSYRWDSAQLRTTKENYRAHRFRIPRNRLPNAIKDAVHVARQLMLPYLWVDSLCIIQDSKKDKEAEIGKMADIYSRAFITIAATASSHSNQGFLFPRRPASCIRGTSGVGPATVTYIRRDATTLSTVENSPLLSRGWVLQEMMLSTRVVHFAQDQLFWVCRQRVLSEDGSCNKPLKDTSLGLESGPSARRSWWAIVEKYSTLALTNREDRFPAMAGCTKEFQSRTGRKAAAGLWMDDIHFDLLWQPRRPSPSIVGNPSWSWASFDGPVRSPFGEHDDAVVDAIIDLDPQIDWAGRELASSITKATLRLTARLRPGTFIPASKNPEFDTGLQYVGQAHAYLSYEELFWHTNGLRSSMRDGPLCFDRGQPPESSHVLCLQVSGSQYYHNLLLVERTGENTNEFRRIGVGAVHKELDAKDFFYGVDMMNILLV
ncbi:hypothetical protein DL765_000513 [Monosporascus sp. GIB2]|nr:hypothetical protein DL765_000513 [Monosporascus sp. GIB2]